jgi:hypothetical protein
MVKPTEETSDRLCTFLTRFFCGAGESWWLCSCECSARDKHLSVDFETVRTTQHATVTFVVAVAVVNVARIVVGMLAVLLVMVVAVSVLYSARIQC